MTTHRAAGALTAGQVQHQGPVRRLLASRPWVADVALLGLVLLLGLFAAALALQTVEGSTRIGLYRPGDPAGWRVPAASLAGTVAGAGLLTLRRRRPLAVVVALVALSAASLALAGVLGVLGVCLAGALYAVADARSPGTAWAVCAAVFAVLSVAMWSWQEIGLAEILLWSEPIMDPAGEPARQLDEPPFSAGRRSASVSLLLALLVLGVAAGSAVRARRLHALDIVERYEAMARDRDQSAAIARTSERARISREMHDVVAHSVSVMVALSDGAGAALDRAPERSREALRELSRTGREALSDLQRVLGALDPGDDDAAPADPGTEPVGTDLGAVVERFRAAGLPVTARGLDTPLPPDTSLRLAVVRIVTEGLTNVLRHAPGTSGVHVAVERGTGTVEVEVLDDGGTRPPSGGGSGRGILGMRERAALLGGRVDAGPRAGGGWRVRVVLPWDERTDPRPEDDEGDR
ncbi:histidine kinase [Isoptericola sp. NEAU-Y5]|uniref:histidine kinase n=1 Tax=Isoptericola luteus TaxID=2879484 RepID=A0ABS7ZHU1_9MICO|nr:histidine kinase [Isoptericola sp. NEAU-Y5]MCA5891770.1 histidine kinase [Isoptericola sp. NEAU-Y5]MCA5894603.1 histidine kinase [Isoptericola sp. NEAU-Y5]